MARTQLKETGQIADKIVKEYKPEKIILFGSFASGKSDKDSDIDMLIIKKTRDNFYERVYQIRKIVEPKRPFDPLVFTPQEIREKKQGGDIFIDKIIKNGVVLYEKR